MNFVLWNTAKAMRKYRTIWECKVLLNLAYADDLSILDKNGTVLDESVGKINKLL